MMKNRNLLASLNLREITNHGDARYKSGLGFWALPVRMRM